jgi:hypothetical protein
MRRLAELRIRTKLILIIIFTCNIALLLASITIITYDNYTYRAQKAEEVSAQAGVLAAGMIATLEFEDRKSAQEDLNPLATNPELWWLPYIPRMVCCLRVTSVPKASRRLLLQNPKGNVSKKTKLSSRGRCSRTSAK